MNIAVIGTRKIILTPLSLFYVTRRYENRTVPFSFSRLEPYLLNISDSSVLKYQIK